MQFKIARELIRVDQALESCMSEGHQDHFVIGKETELLGKPPLPKKNKGSHFGQFKKKWGIYGQNRTSTRGFQCIGGGPTRGVENLNGDSSGGVSKQKAVINPYYVRCEQRHLIDCLARLDNARSIDMKVIDEETIST